MENAKKHWIAVLTVFALCLVACKERDTHYEYYDKNNTKPHKVFEVDKATGKMDGSYKEFDKKGTLRIEGSFEEGMRNGTFKEYRENGIIMVENTYKNDAVEGPVKAYNGEGKLVSKGEIRDGKYVHTKFFTDPRDGQKYPVVAIGLRVWMAANLNYKTGNSLCFDDDEAYCEEYGRLYSWRDADNACPDGWDIPSYKEWKALNLFVGGDYEAGRMLRSASGWPINDWRKNGYGIDAFGFSALPAGMAFHNPFRGKRIIYEGRMFMNTDDRSAYFWSSTEGNHGEMYAEKIFYLSDGVDLDFPTYKKQTWLPVRCIKEVEGSPKRERGEPDDEEFVEESRGGQNDMAKVLSAQMLDKLSNRKLSSSDLSAYSSADLRILRNAIFAKHGYIFKSDDLKKFFSQFDWYNPRFENVDSELSTIEKNNISFIKQKESSGNYQNRRSSVYERKAAPREKAPPRSIREHYGPRKRMN